MSERDDEVLLLGNKIREIEAELAEKCAQLDLVEAEKTSEVDSLKKKIEKVQNEAVKFYESTGNAQREAQEYKDKVHSQKENLLLQITDLKTENSKMSKEIAAMQEKIARLEEVDAENNCIKEQQQLTEANRLEEREKWENLLKSSQDEIALLSRDYDKFAEQLQEKDEHEKDTLQVSRNSYIC